MTNQKQLECNRRDFLKYASVGAAAMAVPGLISNANAASVTSVNQEIMETDVLVIGGGIAGVFAAIRAKEQGVDVILAEKGTIGKSGLSPFFATWCRFDKAQSYTKQEYLNRVAQGGDYLANRDYAAYFVDYSMDVYNEMKSWGVKYDPKGSRSVILRDQVKKAGIRMVERTMMTELLEKDGQVIGAAGFPMEEDKAIVIKAKTVVISTGCGTFKTPGWPGSSITHDGEAMAYRIGAEISGKEFVDPHVTNYEYPADYSRSFGLKFGFFDEIVWPFTPENMPGGRGVQGEGDGGRSPQTQGGGPGGRALQAHLGNLPMRTGGGRFRPPEGTLITGCAAAGAAPHKCEGLFPKDDKCASNVPGLFAAGDSLCTAGASYGAYGAGSSAPNSAIQGGIAGRSAAEYAKTSKILEVTNAQIASVKKNMFEPRSRAKGYSPAWVTQVLQGLMVPYYVLYVKKEDRLKAALTNIEFLRDHFAPGLLAKDTHDLRLAIETRNMIYNAEAKLRAGLLRTESRGNHYREDYPEKDDKNWLAWVIITRDGDKMKLTKRPIPDEWKPST